MNKDGTLDIEGDLRKTIATLEQRVADLEAKLVERDVYEAQQILPPEQAALIKHLATVERCIDEATVSDDDDGAPYCMFCNAFGPETNPHDKGCAWLALQFDRKPAETMAMVEGWAWEENARRDRERARAMTPQQIRGPALSAYNMGALFRELWPPERVYGNLQNDLSAFERGAEIHRDIQARLEAERPVVIHQSGPVAAGIGPISLCGVESDENYPPGSPTVTCPACLALLFPPKPEVP